MLRLKKNLIRAGFFSALIIGSMVLLQACFPYGPQDIEEFDIVGTFYDKELNFSTYKTYAMPDSVAHLGSGANPPSRDYDALVLSQVAANMDALGYTRVEDPDQSDMLVTIGATKEAYSLDNSYDSGDAYGDDYDYGTFTYYDSGSGYEIETGTVLINMVDHKKNPSAVTPMWLGVINGVTEQSYTNTSRRLIELINKCFSQSPYLGTSSN